MTINYVQGGCSQVLGGKKVSSAPLGIYIYICPRPRPAFHNLQYGKVGRAWYLFSYEDGVINKWPKNSECKSKVKVQQTTSSTLGVYKFPPTS